MGYSYRNNGQIKDYWPDDTDTILYISDENIEFNDLCERIKEKFGLSSFDNIMISSERIHTSCLTYDLYDPMDYTNFIVVRKVD